MKEIKLTKGYVAMVGDEDYDHLVKFTWQVCFSKKRIYAKRTTKRQKGITRTSILMHREILGIIGKEIDCDHKDRNGLNNQRENLRIATRSQNNANQSKKENTSSIYIGVSWYKNRSWRATIKSNGKAHYLGCHKKEKDAAIAYNEAAIKYHGEFANLNQL